jgi:phosphopentomutase
MARFFDRAIIIVLDSAGVGELPDAARFGDEGSNTLGNIQKAVGLDLPHLSSLGLHRLVPIPPVELRGAYGKMAERSMGKDTTTGHWEIAGLVLDQEFPTYPDGFPPEVIEPFVQAMGRDILWNRPASGTEILKKLGAEHVRTGRPIVYTSADSVFQIAAHEEVIPLKELYEICRVARQILQGKHGVGRVIARPFIGVEGAYTRTANRRDFSLEPPAPTLLDHMVERGYRVIAIGKIEDIFTGRGVSEAIHTHSNQEGAEVTRKAIAAGEGELIFTNLVDFDMKYGHRNDPEGYKRALEEFDEVLPDLLEALHPRDLLILTADHGCDPTTASTDHSREYVPLLCYYPGIRPTDLGIRKSFSDVGMTIAENFELPLAAGESFLKEITR